MTNPIHQLARVLCVLGLAGAMLSAAERPATFPPEELQQAATWFDRLDWPELRGKPYVEVTWGNRQPRLEAGARHLEQRLRGFLVREDAEAWYIFGEGAAVYDDAAYQEAGWWDASAPFAIRRVARNAANAGWEPTVRPESFAGMARGVMRALTQPSAARSITSYGKRCSPFVAAFALARFAVRSGHGEIADEVLGALPNLPGGWSSGHSGPTLRERLEAELSHALTLAASDACEDLTLSRAELAGRFERILREFPASRDLERVREYATTLRQMAQAEAAASQGPRVDLSTLPPAERAVELIRRIPDAPDHSPTGQSIRQQLVELGFSAVPALLEGYTDRRICRGVEIVSQDGYAREPRVAGTVCGQILERLANRRFGYPRTLELARQGQAEARAWWESVTARGERAALIESIGGDTGDAVQSARRLAALDPAAAVEAIAAALRKADVREWGLSSLLEVFAGLDFPIVKPLLRELMTSRPKLLDRVLAARELWRLGEDAALPAMIKELERWDPAQQHPSDDGPGALLNFLVRTEDPRALDALDDQRSKLGDGYEANLLYAIWSDRPSSKDPALSPAAERRLEDFIVRRFDLHGVQGASGSLRQPPVRYVDPRIRELAAIALYVRWPERYPFRWGFTRLERDQQIAAMQRTWSQARGLPAPKLEARPQAKTLNEVTTVGGDSFLQRGQTLTPALFVEEIQRAFDRMPAEAAGFSLSVERLPDGGGFAAELRWRRRTPKGQYSTGLGLTVALEVDGKSVAKDLVTHPSRREFDPRKADFLAHVQTALDAPPEATVSLRIRAGLRE